MPPGYIKTLGVQLLSQPPLSLGEQELSCCFLLLCTKIFHKCCPSPWEGFFTGFFSADCEQEHLDPLRISARRQVVFWLTVLQIH